MSKRNMIGAQRLVLAALLVPMALLADVASAAARNKPSDAMIKRKLRSRGVLRVKLSRSGGRSKYYRSGRYWEYGRWAAVTRKTRWKGVKLVVSGDVIYRRRRGGRWRYYKFRTSENRYLGLKAPTFATVHNIIKTIGLHKAFLGESGIIGDFVSLKMAAKPNWVWHTINSVSFDMVATFWQKYSYTEKQLVKRTARVRLYRTKRDDTWLARCAGGKGACISGTFKHGEKVLKTAKCLPSDKCR